MPALGVAVNCKATDTAAAAAAAAAPVPDQRRIHPTCQCLGGGGTGAANGSLKLSRLFVFLTVGSVAHQLLTYSCWPLLLLLPPGCPLFQPAKAIAEAGDVS
jgi:hypothetical protein